MRVLVVGPGASWSTADVETGVLAGLEALRGEGLEVIRYRLDARIDHSSRWLHLAWRRAVKRDPTLSKPTPADVFYHAGLEALAVALRHEVHAVLVISAMYFHPQIVVLMKRAGLRVVSLFTETPYDLDRELRIAGLVDGVWTHERSAVAAFRAVNPRAGYLAHGWLPGRHTPAPAPEDRELPAHDVIFVGSAFPGRIAFLEAIDWTGIDLGLYGHWSALPSRHPLRRYMRGPVPLPNEMAAGLYRRAKVALNLYREAPAGAPAPESLNPRAYELAACGAVHVSTPRAEIGERFGALVPQVHTPAEASAAIRQLLADPAWRASIASALPSRVVGSSWHDRARDIAADLSALLRSTAAA